MIVLRHCLIATLLAASACATPQEAPPEPTTQSGEPSWRERMQARRAERATGRESDNVSIKEFAFMHDGQERWYTVYAPENLQPGAAAIVLLHGGTQSMRKVFNAGAASGQAWRDVADREGVLLIVPNGVMQTPAIRRVTGRTGMIFVSPDRPETPMPMMSASLRRWWMRW